MSTYQRASYATLLGLAFLGLAWSGVAISTHLSYTRGVTDSARANLGVVTTRAALEIDAILRDAMSGVDEVASGLSTGTLTRDSALARLRARLEARGRLFGSTISYKPFGFDPSRRLLMCWHCVVIINRDEFSSLELKIILSVC